MKNGIRKDKLIIKMKRPKIKSERAANFIIWEYFQNNVRKTYSNFNERE